MKAAVEPASGEVEPHEVAAGFRVDPRAAWTDAIFAIHLAPASSPTPNDWSSLVNQPNATYAVPLAAGNFPQRVKDLHPLIHQFNASELRPSATAAATPGFSTLRTWIESEAKKGSAESVLLAAGVARMLGDFDRAEQLLAKCPPHADLDNERAALLWHRGECDAALAAWNAMADSPAVLFNRGLALLFTGKNAEAPKAFSKTIAVLPESTGWNALARLYQAVAEIQG